MFSDVDDNAPMILDVPFGRIDGVRQQPRTRYGGACYTARRRLIGFR